MIFIFQLYKIRPKRTRPQALLFLCMILLLIVLHTSYMIYSLAPQYVMYGSQKYLVQVRKSAHFCVSAMRASSDNGALTMAVWVSWWVWNHFGPGGCRQQRGLQGQVVGLLDSCSSWMLSICIRLTQCPSSISVQTVCLWFTCTLVSMLCLRNSGIKMNCSVVFTDTSSFQIRGKNFLKPTLYDSQGKHGLFLSAAGLCLQ